MIRLFQPSDLEPMVVIARKACCTPSLIAKSCKIIPGRRFSGKPAANSRNAGRNSDRNTSDR